MLVQKNQQGQSRLPAKKSIPKNQSIKAVARISPAKNARMVTTAGAIVSTALADAVLQPLL
ncbi:hypothetical protein CMU71_11845 [Elizabethkingia anophelis]|uniref:hypothetical protein n=1 Tax=Chryseobacterium camelliae TaxID=1265445 RepID=UPI000C1C9D21|nr:hypothetical protein [Chryseobacterium camelliae]MDV3557896.1 hypothetical protein [Elizabethkingia anophelis]MDV3567596.1 hypothetical protein [Elizabethkingia anophelis]RYD73991.1 MAG: hypothetical protein EOP55_16035 [Sphingobacteriales bacterium]